MARMSGLLLFFVTKHRQGRHRILLIIHSARVSNKRVFGDNFLDNFCDFTRNIFANLSLE